MKHDLSHFEELKSYHLLKVKYKSAVRFAKFLRKSNDEKSIIVQICSGDVDLFKEVKLPCAKVLSIC